MRIFRIRDRGTHGLRLEQAPEPVPGPGELVIEPKAVALNYRDLAIVRGDYGGFVLPLVPLSDGVARVVGKSSDVETFSIGERVMPYYTPDWHAGAPEAESLRRRLGGPLDGVLRERMVVRAADVTSVPDYLSDVEAATLQIAGGSAFQALFGRAALRPGDTLLVQGTGGVSLFALALGVAAGASVIVLSSSDEKLERARELGATHTINYRSEPDWHESVLVLTEGRGVDLSLDIAGGAQLGKTIAATRVGGSLALLGFASGIISTLSLPTLIARGLTVMAASGVSRESLRGFFAACAFRRLRPVIDRTFAFDESAAAFEYFARGSHFGKVVIQID